MEAAIWILYAYIVVNYISLSIQISQLKRRVNALYQVKK